MLMRVPGRWLDAVRRLVQAPGEACLHCGRTVVRAHERRMGLCGSCLGRIAWIRPPTCPRCGKPLRATGATLCADCRVRPVPFVSSHGAAVYDGLWRELVRRLKFDQRRELARPLGVAMADVAWRVGLPRRVHALVPVPASARRLARRGYNQARDLAMVIAEETDVPVLEALVRTSRGRGAGPQSLRAARQRRRALRGAFVAWQPEVVRGLTLAVVDDVYTTGATMDEATRALLRAGAKEVFGLVAAVGVTAVDLSSGGSEGAEGATRWA
ncbi:MAG: ComF family protein [Firmicutes bacterium]|nr:ComF family protein [Bacillota bacterium]